MEATLMNSKEFNQRKREAFPEEVALKNLKELTEAERAGLHLLMIQTSDPDEREDILAEAQKTANQRAEEARKHSYAAVKERLIQEKTETDTELKAFTQHRNRHVKVLGKVTMMAGYFMTPKRIRPTKYYWLVPDDLVIPDRPLGRVAHVRGKDGQLQDVMVLYVTKQKQRQLQDGRVIPDQFMIEFTNQYASSVQVKQGQRTERQRQKNFRFDWSESLVCNPNGFLNFSWHFSRNQIVWQASQPGDFGDGIYAPYGETAVNRVKAAATKVYNNVMNNSDTANTTMILAVQGATDVQGYHKFTYTVQSNQAGTATLNFKNQVAGMKVVDANGNAIANNTVTIGQAFSLLIPDSTPTGNLTFDINGSIKAIVPVVYNDGAQKYQDSISLVTGVVKPLLAGNKAKWTRAAGLIKVHKVDQDGKALAGVEFTLTDNLGNKQTAVTDKDGNAQFAIVANRMYSLKETKTLAGYVGSFQKDGITKVPTLVHYKKGKVVTQYTGYREQQIDKVLAGGKAGEH